MKASNTAMEKSNVNPGKEEHAPPGIKAGSHWLGAHPPRKMSQMSIKSFFGKSASKKVERGKKCDGVENGTKTKKDTAATSKANEGAKKDEVIVLEDDDTASTSSKGVKGKTSQKDRIDSSVDHVSTSGKGGKGKKSQKAGRLDCSLDYVLVFCHLEILRHSLSPELHLTQVY